MRELVPFRWPAGWKNPSKLDLLKGTPVNCLVAGEPPPFPLGDLQFVRVEKDRFPEGVALRDGVWPRILPAKVEDSAEAGATGGPWVDSNAGVIRLAQAMEPGKSVWLQYEAPGGNEVVPFEWFARGVTEAEAYGAHWVVTLSPAFVEGIDKGGDEALRAWKRLAGALAFFDRRRAWRAWEPVAALAVVSSFEGDTGLMSAEFVNLAPRRHLAYRIVRTAEVGGVSFAQQKAVLYIDSGPPEGEVRAKLLEFAEAGGLVVSPAGLVDTKPSGTRMTYHIHSHGKGRIAMPVEPWYDPFLLVAEVHLLLGHREDVVRVWNGPDLNSHLVAGPKGGRAAVHLVQYGAGKTQPVTIGLDRPVRSARIHTLESERAVDVGPGALGVEIPVGEFSGYAAVELEI